VVEAVVVEAVVVEAAGSSASCAREGTLGSDTEAARNVAAATRRKMRDIRPTLGASSSPSSGFATPGPDLT
jgi:hypothetical protein